MRTLPLVLSLVLYLFFVASAKSQIKLSPSEPIEHEGTYDASAGVALNNSLFVLANDEDNVLRVYDRRRSGKPIADFDVSQHLDLGAKDPKKPPEVDIEGATRLGDRVYWISSHGTGKLGDERLERRRFFATQFTVTNNDVRMEFVGKPYKALLEDMQSSPKLKKYDLAAAAKLAPKKGNGFNIEALAATPDNTMLIGFRGPLAKDQRAVLVPFLNPEEVVLQGKAARFGDPIELDLGGLGVRGMEYCAARKEYVVIAGPRASGACRIYRWSGRAEQAPTEVEGIELDGWTPETCVIYPGKLVDRIQILSDDGEHHPATGPKRFRSGWIKF